jgi:oligopeptide transport system substrate-binding protein
MGKFANLAVLVTLVSILGLAAGCTKKVDDKDNTIYSVLKANVKGLDPVHSNDLYSSIVISQIFEGLLEYNPLKRPFQLQPALADGMPVVTDNGLTVTFKIKKGVKFQDNAAFPGGKGRELTAKDFVYSWKRLADPKNVSDGFWIFDGKVKGLNEWAEGMKTGKTTYDSPIEGLATPDDQTLVIKLIKPYYQLNDVLAMCFGAAVPKEAVDKYGAEFLNNPVGTGPFLLEKPSDWIHNNKISLKKNSNWRGETYPAEGAPGDQEKGLLADAGKPLPFADALVFNEVTEDQPRWQNLTKGNYDFAEIPNDNFDGAIKKEDKTKVDDGLAAKGIHLDITPFVDVTYYGFNMKDPILGKNKLLRQAMALASDNPTFIDKFLNGRGLLAQGPIPPGLSSFDPNYKNPYSGLNLAKAKELLAKAGYPEGKGLPELTFESLADSKARQQAEFFAKDLATIGIKVKLSPNTWPQFQEKIKGGRAQIFGIAWGADYPDPQNFFQLFYSKNASPGPNDTSYSNPEFDKVYEAALNLPAGAARDALYVKMRDIVNEDVPWIYTAHRTGYRLVHGWLNNFKWNDIQNDLYKYMRVDPKKRAELKPKL